MNAVIEKRPTRARARKSAPPAKAPAPAASKEQALFAELGDLLDSASATDEPHEYSGESDRLLNIASAIAFRAAKGDLSAPTAQNTAFDVAACINAARLVPGDTESLERTALIASAAQRLAILTECDADVVVRSDMPRPSRTPAPALASAKQFTEEQFNKLHWGAYVHMDCARSVIFHYAEHANSKEVFALRDLLDVYCEAAYNRFKDKESGDLSNGPLPDLSADLSKILHLLYAVNDAARDDGVLHGVEYLLRSAKRITDGDSGVLDG